MHNIIDAIEGIQNTPQGLLDLFILTFRGQVCECSLLAAVIDPGLLFLLLNDK